MTENPYRSFRTTSFWSRSVARNFEPQTVFSGHTPVFRKDDRIASMGSCFASNLVPYLEAAGYGYVRTERSHPRVAHLKENLGYDAFSARYGNLYTVRQMLQLAQRSMGLF